MFGASLCVFCGFGCSGCEVHDRADTWRNALWGQGAIYARGFYGRWRSVRTPAAAESDWNIRTDWQRKETKKIPRKYDLLA